MVNVQELVDSLFGESEKAGIPMEEIQKEIARRLAEKERKKAFFQFAKTLTKYSSRKCIRCKQIQYTADALYIYNELTDKYFSGFANECSKVWGTTVPADIGRIYKIMCRLKDWNSDCGNPLKLSDSCMTGRGSTNYVFSQVIEYILREEA